MTFKNILSSQDVPTLMARAYEGVTHPGDHYYAILKQLASQVEECIKAVGEHYQQYPIDDESTTGVASELSCLLETMPVTIDALAIIPNVNTEKGTVDNAIMVIMARMGDVEFKIAQKVSEAMDTWAVYIKPKSALFMTQHHRAVVNLAALPGIDNKHISFNVIDGKFSASIQAVDIKSIDAIKRAPFHRLTTDSLQVKPMKETEKLYCLMDLAVRTNSQELAWDVLDTGLCDDKTITMALKNAFQFDSPSLMLSLIKSTYTAPPPEIYELGYLDFRRFDRHFKSTESYDEKLEGLKNYLTPEAASASSRVLDKAQVAYNFDESVRAEFLTSILKAAPSGKRNTVKI